MRGRKPIPTIMRIVSGNQSKRPLPANEPEFVPGIPVAPPWLCDEAKMEWNRIAHELHRAGLLSVAYASSLAVYCQAWSDFKDAVETINRDGATLTTSLGNVIQHPAVGMKNRAMLMILKASAEFGLSPASKARIKVGESRQDELSDFLDRKTA